jgi:hypothetical protein
MAIAQINLIELGFQFNNINLITSEFIEKIQKEKLLFPRFFNNFSEELNLAKSLLEVIRHYQTLNMNRQIYEENDLLKKLNRYYKKLTDMISERMYNEKQVDNDLMDFLLKFSSGLKSIAKIFFPEITDINLFYLECYISCKEPDSNNLSNYLVLKTETISLFKYYLSQYKDFYLKNILISINDFIENSHFDGNKMRKFVNVLNELNSLRLMLINDKENHLLLFVTQVMDNAFEIVRPNRYRNWDMQNSLIINSCDPIANKMTELQ